MSTWGDVIEPSKDQCLCRAQVCFRRTKRNRNWESELDRNAFRKPSHGMAPQVRILPALCKGKLHTSDMLTALLVHHFHNHLDLHNCIMPRAFSLPLLTERCLPLLYVKICQKRREVILYPMHSKPFHRSWGSTI